MSSSMDNQNKLIVKQLKQKASDFLSSRKYANNLVDILQNLETSINNGTSVTSRILILEHLFTELLKRREMLVEVQPLKPKEPTPETQYREWFQERYKEVHRLFLSTLNDCKEPDSVQGMVSSMKLLIIEAKYPIENSGDFPINRFRQILIKMLSFDKSKNYLYQRFQEYTIYHDLLTYLWKIIPTLTPKFGSNINTNKVFVKNFLELINASLVSSPAAISLSSVTQNVETNHLKLIVYDEPNSEWKYDYAVVKKCINKTWNCLLHWNFTSDEEIHRQILILLLEKMLPHLDKPLLLTDLLMESLDYGGPISLLALQGIFILIQYHNLTYPDIYEKLYAMFEPEIFHTKFKARLFYLADIFLMSNYLPENLVAAFVKRLSRLALVAPPQDIIIILQFIGNLMLRHPALKRLISHSTDGISQVPRDPYIMDERKPTESNALESSLWEISSLQSHAIPSISIAAKFISNPLPTQEYDLSQVLELNEDDIFDRELAKKFKNFPLNFEKINSMFLPADDPVKQYWKLF